MSRLNKILEVRDLSVDVQNSRMTKTVLDKITFDLHAGQLLGIIGEAGSGKTVLARALVNGLPEPASPIIPSNCPACRSNVILSRTVFVIREFWRPTERS